MSETWIEWGVERRTVNDGRQVAAMRNREEAESVCQNWADSPNYHSWPVVVSRAVTASPWAPVDVAAKPSEESL